MEAYVPGSYVRQEIESQPQIWANLIPAVAQQARAIRELFAITQEVVFSGCGSALNASLCGAAVLQSVTGLPARAAPAAETYLFPRSTFVPGRKTVVVLLSRSGQTTEVVHALNYLRRQAIPTVGITSVADSPLARGSDLALVLPPPVERAVATTVSLTAMILATQLLAAIVANDAALHSELERLPEICAGRMKRCAELGQALGQRTDLTHYAFVGNGPYLGLAREGQLKVKEMALLPADGYPMLDFRHGPQSNVDTQMLLTAFLSDSARQEEVAFLHDMKALGGVTWALCDRADAELKKVSDYVLELDSGLGEVARGALYMPAVQYLAWHRALQRGLNPDEPRHLSYWVDTSR